MTLTATALPPGLTVLERGWLSSNNVLIHSPDGVTLIDSGHAVHAAQTLALVGLALGEAPLRRLVNTHLHSDHCGGNAALRQHFEVPVWLPPGQAEAVRQWDQDQLSYRRTGQQCPRFGLQQELAPGSTHAWGGGPEAQGWQVIAAPGHDPDAVMLFEPGHGVLIAGDALWHNGFGVVFPELEGEPAFDTVGETLAQIERLPVRCVIPGHGSAFSDVDEALSRAWSRLESWRREPARHHHHAARVLLKYHLMEEDSQPLPALLHWLVTTPLMRTLHERSARRHEPLADWGRHLIDELLALQALRLDGQIVRNV